MAQKKEEIYNGKNGMTYVRTDAGGIALTDELKKLYGGSLGGIDTQYAAAVGTTETTPSALIEQYSSALKAAEAARANSALASLDLAAKESDAQYDTAARQLYAQKTLGERAMANSLASSGLYNSGYSDSARIALENSYASNLAESESSRRAAADRYRLEGIDILNELAASEAEIDAKVAEMALGQMNTERDLAFELQKYADSRADAERDYALELEKYNDAKQNLVWDREQAERAYADTRADLAYQREQDIAKAKSEQAQLELKNAYAAAEMGDFSLLEALGIDTAAAKAAYNAELELLVLKLAEAKNQESSSGGTSVGAGSSSSGKTDSSTASSPDKSGEKNKTEYSESGNYETEFAIDMANRLVSNMQAQNKSYSEVLDYIGSIRQGVIKQFGQAFWEKYVDVISKTYPGGSGYTEPEHLSSMDSVMAFIKDTRNAARFFTDDGYNLNAIRELINNADLSEAERRELRAYYGISKSANSGKIGTM